LRDLVHLRGLVDRAADQEDAWAFHATATHYAVVMSLPDNVCVTLATLAHGSGRTTGRSMCSRSHSVRCQSTSVSMSHAYAASMTSARMWSPLIEARSRMTRVRTASMWPVCQ